MAMLSLITTLVNVLLMVIVLIGGIILMAVRKKDHGRGSSLGIAGCVVLFIGLIGQTAISFFLRQLIDVFGYEIGLLINSTFTILTQVAGITLLIFGVVARRIPRPAAGQPQTWPTQPGHHAQPGWPQPGQQPEWQAPWQPEQGAQPQPGLGQPGWGPQQPGQQVQPGGQPPQQGWQPPQQGYQPPSQQ
ncbi:hypothetical protein [Nonomuraea sp. NPDC049309]|uniref:hypothetical protein n=1 Tax=Nonomuraea sp. NPDC049309 TaxID=3364350 RepID=UPI003718B4B4